MRGSLAPLFALILAACGGKAQPQPTPISEETRTVAEPTEGAGDDFGGEPYGGQGYGGDGYGYHDGYDEDWRPPPPPEPVAPDLTGTWIGPCASSGAIHQRLTFVGDADGWRLRVEMFKDSGCTTRTQALDFAGTLAFGEPSQAVSGAWDTTLHLASRDLTVDDAKTAKAMGKACKLKKLKKGQTVSLHEKGCAKLGLVAAASCSAEHTIVLRVGSRLQLGVRPADNDLCAVEKRPTAVDTGYQLAYQWKSTGIPECDAYIGLLDQYLNCPQFPADVRDSVFDSVKMVADSFLQAGGATGISASCNEGANAMTEAMKAMGC